MQIRRMPAKSRILWGFLLLMLACTFISRIYDSVTVPKVLTTTAKQKAVETLVEGTGTVKEKETSLCRILPGLRVGRVAAEPGSQVEEGQELFSYDLESIREKREELERELEQIDLNIRREQISQEASGEITQEELAARELALAQRALEEGELEFADTQKEHQEELARLEQEYRDDRDLLEDELSRQQDQSWKSARQGLDTAKNSRNRELRAARRTVEDLAEELDQVPEEDEERIRKLSRDLERAREDLRDLEDTWEEEIDSAEDQVELADDLGDRILAGQTTAQEERRRSYEQVVKQQEEKLEQAAKDLEALKDAVEEARWQLAVAEKQDAASRISEDQRKRISALNIQGLKLDRKAKERQLNRLEELEAGEGIVCAHQKGIVVDMELTGGKTTTGEELVSLAVGESRFEGMFLKEDQKLSRGDAIQISIPGTVRKKDAIISRINLLGEEEGLFQADLGDLELPLGTIANYTCRKQSDMFPKVIPLSGIRKDMTGYYCLVARTRSSILGEEFAAERVNIQILYQGSQEAAVEGSIFDEDRVITGENKTIGAGDRVRPVPGF